MSLGTILLIVLVLMLIGALPAWPHSRGGASARAVAWAWFFSSSWCCWSWVAS